MVASALKEVIKEHSDQNTDIIDAAIERKKEQECYKICPDCKIKSLKKARKCPGCSYQFKAKGEDEPTVSEPLVKKPRTAPRVKVVDVSKYVSGAKATQNDPTPSESLQEDRFNFVPSGHSGKKYKTLLQDPAMVNPNSYENLKIVNRKIGQMAGMRKYGGSDRLWCFVVCDGSPYPLVVKLMLEYCKCVLCQKGFMGTFELQKHFEKEHAHEEISFLREFDWYVPVIGGGHEEMTLIKSWTDLTWHVCHEKLSVTMGFKTENALRSAKACSDHHRAYQKLQIHYLGTLLEMLVLYVRSCFTDSRVPSAEDFLTRYCEEKSSESDMFHFMSDITLRYAAGILHFRMGMRRNNQELVESARFMTKELLHGRHHPKYKNIEIMTTFIQRYAPPEVRDCMAAHVSVSKSGNPSAGQAPDFQLEECNKDVHKWHQRGVPSHDLWRQIIWNIEGLSDIRSTFFGLLDIPDKGYARKSHDITQAVAAWRCTLRESGILSSPTLKSMSGVELNPGLVHFTTESTRRRDYNIMEYLLGQEPPKEVQHPVPVTMAEKRHFESLDALTVNELDTLIEEVLTSISIDNFDRAKEKADEFNKKIRLGKREAHVAFYHEVSELAKSLTLPPSADDEHSNTSE